MRKKKLEHSLINILCMKEIDFRCSEANNQPTILRRVI